MHVLLSIEDVMGLTIEEDRAKDHMERVVRFAMVVLHKFLFHVFS